MWRMNSALRCVVWPAPRGAPGMDAIMNTSGLGLPPIASSAKPARDDDAQEAAPPAPGVPHRERSVYSTLVRLVDY